MAELLRSFDETITHEGIAYRARVVGRHAEDGMWEGWIEFVASRASEPVLVTGVESRQPRPDHLAYWAAGLSGVYLEGAFRRALDAAAGNVRAAPEDEVPLSHAPAPHPPPVVAPAAAAPQPILDPFEIGSRSPDILRQELTALNRPRLLTIIAAFDLNPAGDDLGWMSDAQLVTFIATSVEATLQRRHR